MKVLTDMRAIPDTPFYIITKVDTYEIFSEIYYRAYITITIAILLIIIISFISFITYHYLTRTFKNILNN